MNVFVAIEARFDRTPDGVIWTQSTFDRSFWNRYLDVFDGVRIIARVRDVLTVPPTWQRVEGDRVAVAAVPHYHGPQEYLRRRRLVARSVREAVGRTDAVVLRAPTFVASALQPRLMRQGHPYGVEVVADPYESLAPGAVKHPLRPFVRWWATTRLRKHCRGAAATAYVTEHALQRRYPGAAGAMTTYYSSIDLEPEAFAAGPITIRPRSGRFTLIGVGSLAQPYKGLDVLIDALQILRDSGTDVRVVWVGDGMYRWSLEQHARTSGVADRVHFTGELPPGESIRAELDRADLFVMPSRGEGMPKAMIEAMARGLPCIGSRIGGIPELLTPADMVPPGDPVALAGLIRTLVSDPARLSAMSERSLEKAAAYHAGALRARRLAFYSHLRATTEAWVRSQGPSQLSPAV